jgi:hypothetical protein
MTPGNTEGHQDHSVKQCWFPNVLLECVESSPPVFSTKPRAFRGGDISDLDAMPNVSERIMTPGNTEGHQDHSVERCWFPNVLLECVESRPPCSAPSRVPSVAGISAILMMPHASERIMTPGSTERHQDHFVERCWSHNVLPECVASSPPCSALSPVPPLRGYQRS